MGKAQLDFGRRKYAKYEPGKVQCKICGGWYHRVCSHVWQRHEMSSRQYKEACGYWVTKGICSP